MSSGPKTQEERTDPRVDFERIENIQVVLSIGIIGWYVTQYERIIRLEWGQDGIFFGYTIVAVAYLVIKTNTITLRLIKPNKYVRWMDRRGTTFLFLLGFNGMIVGYLIRTLIYPFVSESEQLLALIGMTSGLIIFSWFTAKKYAVSREAVERYESKMETLIENPNTAAIVDFLVENPDLIEDGFRIEDVEPKLRINNRLFTPDLVGRDADGQRTAVDVKPHCTQEIVEDILATLPELDETLDRRILVCLTVDSTARQRLENKNVTVRELREFSGST